MVLTGQSFVGKRGHGGDDCQSFAGKRGYDGDDCSRKPLVHLAASNWRNASFCLDHLEPPNFSLALQHEIETKPLCAGHYGQSKAAQFIQSKKTCLVL